MEIGQAVSFLKAGRRVARQGWNGKDMFLLYAGSGTFSIDGNSAGDMLPHVVMKTVQGQYVPWLCSQTDLLATDWEEVAGPNRG